MRFTVRRFFSGFCTYEVYAEDEISAYEKTKRLPIDKNEISNSLEEWKICDEIMSND